MPRSRRLSSFAPGYKIEGISATVDLIFAHLFVRQNPMLCYFFPYNFPTHLEREVAF